jgi:hypothetical protein
MKMAEFFERAFQDAPYRHEKQEELRYWKKACIWGQWITGIPAVIVPLYVGARGERLFADICRSLMPFVICAVSYSSCVVRLAALEAFEKMPNKAPLRMPVGGTPAAVAPVAPPPGIAGR